MNVAKTRVSEIMGERSAQVGEHLSAFCEGLFNDLLESYLVLKPKSTPVKWTMTTRVATIREALCALTDARKGDHNRRCAMGDAALGAFSVFFLQSHSFLDFQVRMRKARGATPPVRCSGSSRFRACNRFALCSIPSHRGSCPS
jgi:hypothetical protein